MDDLSPKNKLKLALAWLREMKAISPTDASPISAARIYHINEETVKSAWFREKNRGTPRPRGGHNRILSEAQHDALIQYAKDQGRDLGATKSMLFRAVVHLKATETLPAPPPSDRWFQNWLKQSKVLLLLSFRLL
jgi:hypothetical protein